MYKLYKDLIEIRAIEKYYRNKPIFGDVLGVYHPLLANILTLNKTELNLYNKLKTNSKDVKTVPQTFINNYLVVAEDEKLDLSFPDDINIAEAYIKLTEGCNFSCTGCATASDKIHPSKAKTLTADELSYLIKNYFRSCHEKNIANAKIKWAGGEPLLGNSYKLIENTQADIKKLAEKFSVKIEQTILTNGVFLTKEKISFAKENNIHIAVSLWGTKKYQNLTRKPRTRNESYDVIINNIKALIENKNSFNLNYIISPINAIDFPYFLETVWDTTSKKFIGNDKPLRLAINVYRPTGVTDKVLESYYNRIEKGLRSGFVTIHKMLKNGVNLLPLGRLDYLDLFSLKQSACGTTRNYVALGPEGVSACHESLFDMKENYKMLEKVNMLDLATSLWENENGMKEKLNGENIDYKYLDFLKYQGASGCPRLAKSVNKKTGQTSPTEKLYSNIYYELLCLETMRLLRYK